MEKQNNLTMWQFENMTMEKLNFLNSLMVLKMKEQGITNRHISTLAHYQIIKLPSIPSDSLKGELLTLYALQFPHCQIVKLTHYHIN